MITTISPTTVTASRSTLTRLMQPQHSNSLGSVHGGEILKMCDECGAIVAVRHARNPVVTVHLDSMTFLHPIRVGQLVSVHGHLTYVGRTSLEVALRVEAENLLTGEITQTHTAYFVYVAIDREGRPVPVPSLELTTDEEHTRFEAGRRRQAARLERRDEVAR